MIREVEEFGEVHMTITTKWYEAYKAAVLETDGAKMEDRILAAESAIRERHHEFSLNHGGTPEEREAIADALDRLKVLRQEAALWSGKSSSERGLGSKQRTDGAGDGTSRFA
jgi:hypothetical protein